MQCPSCGSGIEAEERFGHFRVCPYCQSALLLDKEAAKISGKMAVLAKPSGPLFVGATGNAETRGFEVIGRVRYAYGQGFWDEWYLRFEDGETGWIGEDENEFTVEVAQDWAPDPELFETIRPGDHVPFPIGRYSLKEKGVAICEGGEGQLPFAVEAGEETPFLDAVADSGAEFLSLEFGDEGPRCFRGRQLERDELHVDTANWDESDKFRPEAAAGSRERVYREAHRSEALSCDCCGGNLGVPEPGLTELKCEYCGSAVDLTLERIRCQTCTHPITIFDSERAESTKCPNCQTQVQLQNDTVSVIAQLNDLKKPQYRLLPLGQSFQFEGASWRVAGVLRFTQTEEGTKYHWYDYLLSSPDRGYAWLCEENGHYSFVEELKNHPKVDVRRIQRKKPVPSHGQTFKVFERGEAEITWVDGEFPWVAKVGDRAQFLDATSPPYSLSAEWNDQELEWFRGKYLSRDVVVAALGKKTPKLPKKKGIGMAEPYEVSAFRRMSGKLAGALALLAFILFIWSLAASSKPATVFSVNADEVGKPWVSEPFQLEGSKLSRLVIENKQLTNAWSYFDVAILDAKDRAVHDFSVQMGSYSGKSGGESWSEGSRSDTSNFVIEEAGEYRVLLQGQAGTEPQPGGGSNSSFATEFRVEQGIVLTRYFVILFIASLLWMAWAFLPKMIHESQRWSDT